MGTVGQRGGLPDVANAKLVITANANPYSDQTNATNDIAINKAADAARKECECRPLPFVVPDPEDPNRCLSLWTVTETGDDLADQIMGLGYAEDLLQRAKQLSRQFENPAAGRIVIEAVVHEIVRSGKIGPIEQGFL